MVKAPGIDGLGKPSGSLSHPPESSVRTQSTMGLKKRLKAAPSPLPELHPPRPTCPATRQEKHTKCSGPSIQCKSQSELSLIGEKKQHSRVTPGPGATVSSQFHSGSPRNPEWAGTAGPGPGKGRGRTRGQATSQEGPQGLGGESMRDRGQKKQIQLSTHPHITNTVCPPNRKGVPRDSEHPVLSRVQAADRRSKPCLGGCWVRCPLKSRPFPRALDSSSGQKQRQRPGKAGKLRPPRVSRAKVRREARRGHHRGLQT